MKHIYTTKSLEKRKSKKVMIEITGINLMCYFTCYVLIIGKYIDKKIITFYGTIVYIFNYFY